MRHAVWSWCAKLVVAAALSSCAFAQGFDWVPTYLLPFRIPTVYAFAGLRGDGASLYDARSITEGTLTCASYGNGSGVHAGLVLGGEWWAMPDATLSVLISVGQLRSTHYAAGTTAPLVTGEVLRTEYVLSTSRLYTSVQVAAKKRLVLRYTWLRAGIELGAYLPPVIQQRERVLEPSWYTFTTTPPSREIQIATNTDSRTDLQGSVVLSVGYDVPLRVGLYLLPSLDVAVPLTLNTSGFRLWRIGIAVPVAFSLR